MVQIGRYRSDRAAVVPGASTVIVEGMAGHPGRPPNRAAHQRKVALNSAWRILSSLRATDIAARLRVPVGSFYALVHPSRDHLPTSKVLRTVASLLRDHASKLATEADRLEGIADETDANE